MNLPPFYINLALFLIPLVQALLSKTAGLSANFVIFLMLFVLLLLPLLLLLSFEGKLLLLPFTPSISVLIPLFKIKLLMIYCLVLLPPMTYLESLDVSVLFLFKIMNETNFSLVLFCVVFLGMELVKKVIGVMIPLENVFVFLGMWSFGNTKCFTNYLMFMFPLFPLSILSLTFFLRSLPPLCLSLPLLLLMFLLMQLMSFLLLLVLTVPLQPNFTVIIEVLFKLLIMMSSMNVLNIMRLIVTSFVIIYFKVHSHFSLFPLRIS